MLSLNDKYVFFFFKFVCNFLFYLIDGCVNFVGLIGSLIYIKDYFKGMIEFVVYYE